MDYKIEQGVPAPIKGVGRRMKYPFADMEVGDSFVVPSDVAKKVCCAAHAFGKRSGLSFTSRSLEDGSVRIWRVA